MSRTFRLPDVGGAGALAGETGYLFRTGQEGTGRGKEVGRVEMGGWLNNSINATNLAGAQIPCHFCFFL